MVDASGNKGLTNRTRRSTPPQTEKKEKKETKEMSCAGKILFAIGATVFVVVSITILAIPLSGYKLVKKRNY
ncbi:hypothetical protein TB2_033740 [Malus domestica]